MVPASEAERWKTEYRALVDEQEQALRSLATLREALAELLRSWASVAPVGDDQVSAITACTQALRAPPAHTGTDSAVADARRLVQQLVAGPIAVGANGDALAASLDVFHARWKTLGGLDELVASPLDDPLAEIERLAEGVATRYADLSERLVETERFLAEVRATLARFEAHVLAAEETVAAGRDASAGLESDVAATVDSLESEVASSDDLPALKRVVRARFRALAERIARFRTTEDERLAEAEARNAALQAEIMQLQSRTARLNATLAAQRDQLLQDQLTGVHSRLAFERRMEEELARHAREEQPLSFTIWDIDHFKRVNDTWGHPAGDHVLRAVAQLLQRYTRAADFVARLGGEEFVVLLPATRVDQARVIADKLRELVAAKEHTFDGGAVTVTVSCGIAEAGAGDTAADVYARADAALYEAKAAGRNRCVDQSAVAA